MERIDVAFPNSVSEAKVKMIVENFLKNNTDFRCEVNFIRRNGEDNLYMVEYNVTMALYFIGFAFSGMYSSYIENKKDLNFPKEIELHGLPVKEEFMLNKTNN